MSRRWWFLRWSSAKHIPTWAADELATWRAARDADRQARLIGPVPPPAEWTRFDRRAEP
jgi:hypothetical protein